MHFLCINMYQHSLDCLSISAHCISVNLHDILLSLFSLRQIKHWLMGPTELLCQAAAGPVGSWCSASPEGALLGGAAVTQWGGGKGCLEGTGDHRGFFSLNGEWAHATAWLRKIWGSGSRIPTGMKIWVVALGKPLSLSSLSHALLWVWNTVLLVSEPTAATFCWWSLTSPWKWEEIIALIPKHSVVTHCPSQLWSLPQQENAMVCTWGTSQVSWSGSKIILVWRSPSLPTIPACFQRGTEAGEEEEDKPSAACLTSGSGGWVAHV